jgi:uncharacterized membrane protein (UPF0127 family)
MKSWFERKTKAASLLPVLVLAALFRSIGCLADAACAAAAASHVQVGRQSFKVEVATSQATRERGLSGRPGLPADAGMWFVFPSPGRHGFWMRDMAFAIDLAWIGPDRRVLGVARLEPCGPYSCPIHYPPAPAAYVLEVGAGRFSGQAGDPVTWTCAP